ncbi:MAG TPA: ABC transporter ATP-binding protein [Actinomycetota bacterium]|nr:ABC transporter ATP-binding protein [Actinomycetota bacterium]
MILAVDAAVGRGTFTVEAAFDAEAGETVAVLGPNGSGKSTLVAALAGLLPLERGRVELDGGVLDDPASGVATPPEERPVGVVFQDLLLFPHLSALDNVAFPLRARGIGKAEARDRSRHTLERFGIGDRADAPPRDLSGGEAQRVALARALVAEPMLLLLDEPLSALDVATRAQARELVRDELGRFPGVRVLVTHDPVEASMLADRLVIMEQGTVTQIGTPEQIRSGPRTRYAAELVGVNAVQGRLERIEEGAGRLVPSDGIGDLVVPWPDWYVGGDVIAIVRPVDVTLWLDQPDGSARNVLRGRVTSVAIEGDRARVRVGSAPPLFAELTVGSLERLGLRPGTDVWGSVKAVEIDVLPI